MGCRSKLCKACLRRCNVISLSRAAAERNPRHRTAVSAMIAALSSTRTYKQSVTHQQTQTCEHLNKAASNAANTTPYTTRSYSITGRYRAPPFRSGSKRRYSKPFKGRDQPPPFIRAASDTAIRREKQKRERCQHPIPTYIFTRTVRGAPILNRSAHNASEVYMHKEASYSLPCTRKCRPCMLDNQNCLHPECKLGSHPENKAPPGAQSGLHAT